jgi:hypothetical protein
MRPDAIFVRQSEKGIVVDLHSWTTAVELRVDVDRGAEQQQSLVNEVAAEVKEQSAGFFRGAVLAPVLSDNRAPAIEARLEAQRLAQGTLGDESLNGDEIAVPSAILKDTEDEASAFRLSHERTRFAHAGRERFVDDDVQPLRERFESERGMRAVRRRNHDEIDLGRVLPQSCRGVDDACIGVRVGGVTLALRVAGDNDRQPESRRRHDQRCMEGCTREPIADESDPERVRCLTSCHSDDVRDILEGDCRLERVFPSTQSTFLVTTSPGSFHSPL